MRVPKLNLDVNTFWHRWRANITRSTAHLLIGIWFVTSLGIHAIGELPSAVRHAIIAILLAASIELLFKIYFAVRATEPEISYKDFQAAIGPMLGHIKEQFEDNGRPVSVEFIGVAMFHGCEFITQNLRDLVGAHPKMRVEVEICMNSRQFLETFGFDKTLVNWPELAQLHLEGLLKMMTSKHLSCDGRLQIKGIYVYENLPHWHGILIGHHDLFLSRSKWAPGSFDEQRSEPIFTAGVNKYRYYFTHDKRCGGERIAAFESWFQFYKRIAKQTYQPPPDNGQNNAPNQSPANGTLANVIAALQSGANDPINAFDPVV